MIGFEGLFYAPHLMGGGDIDLPPYLPITLSIRRPFCVACNFKSTTARAIKLSMNSQHVNLCT